MELAIIGVDGLDPDLVTEWRSDLPTLNRLMDDGISCRLRSTDPPLSSPAWPTLFTGKQGGKHGVFSFTRRGEGYQRTPVNYADVSAESLWEALDSDGVTTGVVNVPVTHPPSNLEDGFVIAGWPVPNRAKAATPALLLDELESELGSPYEVNPFPLTIEFSQLEDEELFEEIRDGLRHHAAAFEYLIESHSLDVFLGVFMGIDIASHNFAWNHELLRRSYVEQDRLLGKLLEVLPDDTDVIVVSDHGHGAKGNRRFHVNRWLEQEGYLTRAETGKSGSEILGRFGITQENYVRLRNRLSLGDIHRKLPDPVYRKLRSLVPREDAEVGQFDPGSINWLETIAFSPDQNLIYLNRADSYPRGTVPPDEVEEITRDLQDTLAAVDHPEEDRGLMTHVSHKDELFDGPYRDRAPELVFVADDMKCKAAVSMRDETFTKTRWGEHRQHGVLIAQGSAFTDSDDVGNLDIIDVFPLVLGLMGSPIPDDTDGEVPRKLIAKEVNISYRKSRDNRQSIHDYTNAEAEEVKNQLEGLGYLE